MRETNTPLPRKYLQRIGKHPYPITVEEIIRRFSSFL
jgi:hypothetical protein